MRLLLTAIYDAPRAEHVRGDSCFLWTRFMAEAAVERGWFVYWLVPDVAEVPSLPRIKVIRFPFPPRVPRSNLYQHHLVMKAVQEEFVGVHGDRFVDAVVCNDSYLALQLRDYFGARRFFEPTPVLHWHGYPTIKDWSETNWELNGDDSPLYIRALGYALADFVSCCPYCSGRIFELVQAYCPPQMVKRFLETRSEVMMCADCDFLDSLDESKNERFSMYWGGRFTQTKGGERSLKQYLQFVMAGREADIFITAIGGAVRLDKTLKEYGAGDLVKVFRGLPYEQAQRIMKRCHASIFHQLNPGAAAPYEQMYAGLVVMFKRHHYPEEDQMYPPGYPFLFNADEEGAAMLRWVADHYEEAQRQLAECGVRQWVRERTDKAAGANRILDIALSRRKETFTLETYKWFEDTVSLVEKSLQAFDPPVSISSILDGIDRIKGRKIVQRNWGAGINGILPISVYRSFVPPGWRDDCLTDTPRYVRDGG